jgi:hypothetical protein
VPHGTILRNLLLVEPEVEPPGDFRLRPDADRHLGRDALHPVHDFILLVAELIQRSIFPCDIAELMKLAVSLGLGSRFSARFLNGSVAPW